MLGSLLAAFGVLGKVPGVVGTLPSAWQVTEGAGCFTHLIPLNSHESARQLLFPHFMGDGNQKTSQVQSRDWRSEPLPFPQGWTIS